ncbi:hypothetical protein [Streptomyces galilaeus]|uniref:hypothetical protein n=1 Tax=Streptomyces galilaeus TaxID=33899 RepID=UPI0038F6D605
MPVPVDQMSAEQTRRLTWELPAPGDEPADDLLAVTGRGSRSEDGSTLVLHDVIRD